MLEAGAGEEVREVCRELVPGHEEYAEDVAELVLLSFTRALLPLAGSLLSFATVLLPLSLVFSTNDSPDKSTILSVGLHLRTPTLFL